MTLAYETATHVCSVAFQNAHGERFEQRSTERGKHSEHVFLFTRSLMEEHGFSISDVTRVLVSNGPGSYTGLRIAASAVKGLLFGLDIPLYAGNTLASIGVGARPHHTEHTVHAILDARRTHVYHQAFDTREGLSSLSEPAITEITEFERQVSEGDVIAGTGLNRLNSHLLPAHTAIGEESISAVHLFDLPSVFLTKTSPEAFDATYITTGQVNNSPS
ncbi:MAG: tRNA (adenosine(37)-N6)-threonylcarbamoyltransferase complex dimerization subunit type 1 TsaB [Bacteroidota bacterium]